jgi:hypothetical protein
MFLKLKHFVAGRYEFNGRIMGGASREFHRPEVKVSCHGTFKIGNVRLHAFRGTKYDPPVGCEGEDASVEQPVMQTGKQQAVGCVEPIFLFATRPRDDVNGL